MADSVVPAVSYGTDNLVKIAAAAAKLLSVASELFHKQFLAVFQLSGPFTELQGVDFQQALLELKDLQPEERKVVEAAFVANLSMVDPAVQAKIVGSVAYVDEAVGLVAAFVAEIQSGADFVARLKAFLGL